MNFNYIINPESGKRVSINGKTGKKVLANYLQKIGWYEGIIGGSSEEKNNQEKILNKIEKIEKDIAASYRATTLMKDSKEFKDIKEHNAKLDRLARRGRRKSLTRRKARKININEYSRTGPRESDVQDYHDSKFQAGEDAIKRKWNQIHGPDGALEWDGYHYTYEERKDLDKMYAEKRRMRERKHEKGQIKIREREAKRREDWERKQRRIRNKPRVIRRRFRELGQDAKKKYMKWRYRHAAKSGEIKNKGKNRLLTKIDEKLLKKANRAKGVVARKRRYIERYGR